MIRRLEIGLLRLNPFLSGKTARAYRFILGGTCGAGLLIYNSSVAHNEALGSLDFGKRTSEHSSRSLRGGGGSGKGSGGGGSGGGPGGDSMDQLIDQIFPMVQRLGFGGMMGVCTGVALKRIGNEFAAVIGVGFVCLQGLAYMGYINIDYNKVRDDAKKLIDQDGDGALTSKDVKMLWHKIKDFLVFNLPSAGGFSAGFVLGVRYGA